MPKREPSNLGPKPDRPPMLKKGKQDRLNRRSKLEKTGIACVTCRRKQDLITEGYSVCGHPKMANTAIVERKCVLHGTPSFCPLL